jgi:hypothetical protein
MSADQKGRSKDVLEIKDAAAYELKRCAEFRFEKSAVALRYERITAGALCVHRESFGSNVPSKLLALSLAKTKTTREKANSDRNK